MAPLPVRSRTIEGTWIRHVPLGADLLGRADPPSDGRWQRGEIMPALYLASDAQERARRASELVQRDGADAHIVEALREAQAELGDLHRRLMQGTYYAVSERAQQLAV